MSTTPDRPPPCHRRLRSAAAGLGLLGALLVGGCAGGGGDDVEGAGRPAAAAFQGVEREWAQEVEQEWGAASAGPRPMAAYDRVSNGHDGAAGASGAAAAGPTRTTYRLNSGDVVQISVWREEELQRQALVQPDGSISFPLIGQVAAAGRTVGEVEAEIAGRLARFIPDAVATVELLEARGNKIYVMGEVNRPGEYQLGSTLTVVQAIGLAGGFTQYAATDRIRVLRKGGRDGGGGTATVDYGRIASGRDGGAADVELRAGDTVIVPEEKLFSLF